MIIRLLNLLKQHNLIYGFQHISPKRTIPKKRGPIKQPYPRVRILLKYGFGNTPAIKSIKIFNLTQSDFTPTTNKRNSNEKVHNKLYFTTTRFGCFLYSFDIIISASVNDPNICGKILAEILI